MPSRHMGRKDDPQPKVPSSVIRTLARLAAMGLGGQRAGQKPAGPRRRPWTASSALRPRPKPLSTGMALQAALLTALGFLPLLHLLSQVWQSHHQAQAYALDTVPLPACENIRRHPAPDSSPTRTTAAAAPASRSTSTP
jgi:hypothetical protein